MSIDKAIEERLRKLILGDCVATNEELENCESARYQRWREWHIQRDLKLIKEAIKDGRLP